VLGFSPRFADNKKPADFDVENGNFKVETRQDFLAFPTREGAVLSIEMQAAVFKLSIRLRANGLPDYD